MSTFTIILLIVIFVLIASDVYFLRRIFKSIGKKKKSLPDERYFELKYNINLLKAVSAILIFLLGFLGFTTYKDITSIAENNFAQKFSIQNDKIKALDSIVKNYEGLVQSLKSEEGQSIENLNDVKREFGLINRKISQTQEALRYTTKVYVVNNLEFSVNGRVKKFYFKNLSNIYNENLPNFKKTPMVLTQVRGGLTLNIKEITKDYVEFGIQFQKLAINSSSLRNQDTYLFDMWVAEPD